MIRFEAAYETVMESSFSTGSEEVDFTGSTGRILLNAVRSDMDLPPFDRSTVDGYACRKEDLGTDMKVIEVIAAGMQPREKTVQGTCSRIMTGAPLPDGADYVFMFEDSQVISDDTVKFTGRAGNNNIEKRATDVLAGETVIRPGCLIRPQEVAVMAVTGCTHINVGRKVRAGVITTGNELVEPGVKPLASQIRNSNAWQLLAQIDRAGGTGKYYGIAADNPESIKQLTYSALAENDILILTGGVSAGDFDLVPGVLNEAGFRLNFDSVAVQPGRHLKFWTGDKKIVFGMPGNPVSSFVLFELIVRPLMAKMMGATGIHGDNINLILGTDYSRKRADMMAWIPVKTDRNGEVIPVEYHGSGHITSLHEATGLMAVPLGQSWIQKGETVSVRVV